MSIVSGTVKLWYTIKSSATGTCSTIDTCKFFNPSNDSPELKYLALKGTAEKSPNNASDTEEYSSEEKRYIKKETVMLSQVPKFILININNFAWKKNFNEFKVWGFMVLICSTVMVILTGLTLTTCSTISNANNVKCFSQLNFQITNNSPASQTVITMLNDIVHLFTFLAKEYNEGLQREQGILEVDVSEPQRVVVEPNSPLVNPIMIHRLKSSSSQHPKEIMTFSTDNFFELGFTGYCRTNSTTDDGGRICFGGIINGIDLVATLLRDFGQQLAILTSDNRTSTVSDALALGYEISLPNLSKFLQGEGPVNICSNAMLVKRISKILPFIVTVGFLLNFVNWFQMGLHIICHFNKKLQKNVVCYFLLLNDSFMKKTLLFTSLVTLLINIATVTVLKIYISRMHRILTEEIALAKIQYGTGFYLLVGSLVCSTIQFISSLVGNRTTKIN
ncbi:hypothetical protein DASC09_024560 [Saccharomycopsis crataegensis]|uniref:Uncharacterized protein n=1 Tax=Saccharomycopsis crataegensis TaxID=43959 RepID=A0AAV5QKK7_9ASCO|nr:hypothetical protein DASC09_024560 [Saccharomycopsis crataegensis]